MTDRIPFYEAVYSATIVNGATLTKEQIEHIVNAVLDLQMEMATTLVGGTEVSQRETPQPLSLEPPEYDYVKEQTAPGHSEVAPPGSDIGHRSAAHRTLCSQAAQMDHALPIDRRWRPSLYGYTLDNLRTDYPHLDPESVLESFFQHFISKGTTSTNWMEKFFWFCTNGERMAKERAETGTDSTGQPLDRAERIRRRQAELAHVQEQEEFYRQVEEYERGQQP